MSDSQHALLPSAYPRTTWWLSQKSSWSSFLMAHWQLKCGAIGVLGMEVPSGRWPGSNEDSNLPEFKLLALGAKLRSAFSSLGSRSVPMSHSDLRVTLAALWVRDSNYLIPPWSRLLLPSVLLQFLTLQNQPTMRADLQSSLRTVTGHPEHSVGSKPSHFPSREPPGVPEHSLRCSSAWLVSRNSY